MLIRKRRGWEIAERDATPEDVYLNRRKILRDMGIAGVGMTAGLSRLPFEQMSPQRRFRNYPKAVNYPAGPAGDLYPPERNPAFSEEDAGRPITPPGLAHAYNNYYEFFVPQDEAWRHVGKFVTNPWEVTITGLVENPGTFDLGDLLHKMPMEERVCRFRCVEAWAAVIPWSGFPFRALLDHVQPTSAARFVAMTTALRPDEMPGVPAQPWHPWPYHEGLTIEEARNELAFLATGSYGKPQPKQNGAPIRLIVPWKFGYKNIKSIVRIEFTDEQPPTFWNAVTPFEYGFWSNINPTVPHRRWSQATEQLLNTGERLPTQIYNGYGKWVAEMYDGLPEKYGDWFYR